MLFRSSPRSQVFSALIGTVLSTLVFSGCDFFIHEQAQNFCNSISEQEDILIVTDDKSQCFYKALNEMREELPYEKPYIIDQYAKKRCFVNSCIYGIETALEEQDNSISDMSGKDAEERINEVATQAKKTCALAPDHIDVLYCMTGVEQFAKVAKIQSKSIPKKKDALKNGPYEKSKCGCKTGPKKL